MRFRYTMIKPSCGLVAYTTDIDEVQKRKDEGWIIYGKKEINNKVFKHSNDKLSV